MRYDELKHTQIMQTKCGWGRSKYSRSDDRRFLKKLNARKHRIWDRKLVEIDLNELTS